MKLTSETTLVMIRLSSRFDRVMVGCLPSIDVKNFSRVAVSLLLVGLLRAPC